MNEASYTDGELMVGLISAGDAALGLLVAAIATVMAAAVLAAFSRTDRADAAAAVLGGIFSLLALAALGLGAVDTAMTLMALGVGGVALLASGAALLTEPRQRPVEYLRIRWGPTLVALAIGLALIALLSGADPRRMVETGAPSAAPAAANRFDTALALAALVASGLGVFALLGFGERAAPQSPGRRSARAPDRRPGKPGREEGGA